MTELQLAKARILAFPHLEHIARLALFTEERSAFGLLSLQQTAEARCLSIAVEEATARGVLLPFTIDTTTPQPNVRFEGPHNAVRTARDFYWVTLRTSQPREDS